MSNPNPQTSHLDKYRFDHLPEERAREIQTQGGRHLAAKVKRERTAREIIALALSSEIKDEALQKQIDALGMDGNTVDLALIASTLRNTMRKGLLSDALEAFDAAGRADSGTDEQAHRAFLDALTADDDEQTT